MQRVEALRIARKSEKFIVGGRALGCSELGAASSPSPTAFASPAPGSAPPRPLPGAAPPPLPGRSRRGIRVAAGSDCGSGCGCGVGVTRGARPQRVRRRNARGQRPPRREVTSSEGPHPAPHLRVPAGLGDRGLEGGPGARGTKAGGGGTSFPSPPPSWAPPGALMGRGRGREPSWEQKMGPYGDGRKLLSPLHRRGRPKSSRGTGPSPPGTLI